MIPSEPDGAAAQYCVARLVILPLTQACMVLSAFMVAVGVSGDFVSPSSEALTGAPGFNPLICGVSAMK
jgi:hypothetical protein